MKTSDVPPSPAPAPAPQPFGWRIQQFLQGPLGQILVQFLLGLLVAPKASEPGAVTCAQAPGCGDSAAPDLAALAGQVTTDVNAYVAAKAKSDTDQASLTALQQTVSDDATSLATAKATALADVGQLQTALGATS